MTFETTVQPRYRDLDPNRHVNNAVYATYLEQARLRLFREEIGSKLERSNAVLASLSIDFERPIESLDGVTVRVDVADVGESSVTLDHELLADGDRVATAETVLVALDDDGTPTPLDDDHRAAFERHRAE